MPDLYDNQDSLDQLEEGSNLTDQASSVGSSFVTGKQREKAAQLAKQWIHQFIDAAIEGGIKGVISTFAAPVAIFAILVTAVPLCLVSVKYLLNMSADPVTDAECFLGIGVIDVEGIPADFVVVELEVGQTGIVGAGITIDFGFREGCDRAIARSVRTKGTDGLLTRNNILRTHVG